MLLFHEAVEHTSLKFLQKFEAMQDQVTFIPRLFLISNLAYATFNHSP